MEGARSPSTGEGCDLVACGAPRPGVAGTGSPGDSLNVGLHLTQIELGPPSLSESDVTLHSGDSLNVGLHLTQIEMGVPAQGDQGLGLC